MPDNEPADAGQELVDADHGDVPADLLELYEVLEWEKAVAAEEDE